MLPKRYRLKAREDFERVFRQGKTLFLDEILCLWLPNHQTGTIRVGIAFKGKIFRRAALKHLYKRKILEAFRQKLEFFPPGIDMVILFQKKLSQEKFEFFREKVTQLLQRIDLTA